MKKLVWLFGLTTLLLAALNIALLLRARNFELTDGLGHVRARLFLDKESQPQLTLYATNGDTRMQCGLIKTGDGEYPEIAMNGGPGNRKRLGVYLTADWNPSVTLFDANGIPRTSMAIQTQEGEHLPAIKLLGSDGRPKMHLFGQKDGQHASIYILDKEFNLLWQAPPGAKEH